MDFSINRNFWQRGMDNNARTEFTKQMGKESTKKDLRGKKG